MPTSLQNLHNHTRFSDGAYAIDELCEAHLELRDPIVSGVGISDHLFCTPSSREVTSERDAERLFARETRRYVEYVNEARERWRGRMQVFCGAEINWPLNRALLGWIRGMLTGFDFVVFECADWAGLTQLANQARRWPCPLGLAHANVAVEFPNTAMDQVVRTLANARMFYEINSKLLPLGEDDRWFNLLPQHRVAISLGTDTHDDLSCLRDLKTMHDYAVRRGLGNRFITPGARVENVAATGAVAG
jgi:histidinol phosphatase-like PHP family hydrolase